MASHTEIKVSDTDWVVRVQGEDVRVKVLEKTKKSSGRGYEFRCKRVGGDNRVFGRNITRGSGAFRRPGQAPKATGFPKNASKAKPRAPKRAAPRPTPRSAPRADPAPRQAVQRNPPASAFFSEVQEPGTPRSSTRRKGRTSSSSTKLGSLRGRGRTPAPTKTTTPARPGAPTSAQVRREIEKQLKHAGQSTLVVELVKELVQSDGSEFAAQQIYGRVMSAHRMRSFGIPFRR